MTSTQHTGRTCSEAEADAQTDRVKAIMVDQNLDWHQALDVYINLKLIEDGVPAARL